MAKSKNTDKPNTNKPNAQPPIANAQKPEPPGNRTLTVNEAKKFLHVMTVNARSLRSSFTSGFSERKNINASCDYPDTENITAEITIAEGVGELTEGTEGVREINRFEGTGGTVVHLLFPGDSKDPLTDGTPAPLLWVTFGTETFYEEVVP